MKPTLPLLIALQLLVPLSAVYAAEPASEQEQQIESHRTEYLEWIAPPPTRDDARCPDVGVEKAIS